MRAKYWGYAVVSENQLFDKDHDTVVIYKNLEDAEFACEVPGEMLLRLEVRVVRVIKKVEDEECESH